MKRVRIVEDITDDVIEHETGELVDATEHRVLEVDGKRVELDFTAANADEFDKVQARYLDAGHPPETPAKAVTGKPASRISVAATPIGQARIRNAAIRLYAPTAGYPLQLPRQGNSGGAYLPVAAIKAFGALPEAVQAEWIERAIAARRKAS